MERGREGRVRNGGRSPPSTGALRREAGPSPGHTHTCVRGKEKSGSSCGAGRAWGGAAAARARGAGHTEGARAQIRASEATLPFGRATAFFLSFSLLARREICDLKTRGARLARAGPPPRPGLTTHAHIQGPIPAMTGHLPAASGSRSGPALPPHKADRGRHEREQKKKREGGGAPPLFFLFCPHRVGLAVAHTRRGEPAGRAGVREEDARAARHRGAGAHRAVGGIGGGRGGGGVKGDGRSRGGAGAREPRVLGGEPALSSPLSLSPLALSPWSPPFVSCTLNEDTQCY